MALSLFNTLTRRLEVFQPQVPGRVTMYTCGPTVWNYAHIGNFRTFLFEDLLRRWLEASGYQVLHLMNLTDVDDRIIAEATKRGVAVRDFTGQYTEAFFADRDWLRIRPAHEYPRATEFVSPMIRLVEGLLRSGAAYRGDDGSVYFAIDRFPAYGRLSQLDRRELKAGASGRVSTDEYDKENARDFVLWKAARPEDEAAGAAWDAPFGRGRPGWHLECSAMALALLERHGAGDVLDIHAGGVDLIFPHHEDEIAQSCAYTGKPDFARYWLHGEFLNVRGAKMSKRFGNVTTPRDLKADGVDPGALRLLMFQTHYRQKMDLTDESLVQAREGSRRLGEFDLRVRRDAEQANRGATEPWDDWSRRLESEISGALDNDLNAPQAIAALFNAAREGNRLLDQELRPVGETHLAAWDRAMGVFDVLSAQEAPLAVSVRTSEVFTMTDTGSISSVPSPDPPADPDGQELWAKAWAANRLRAKSRRDYKEADRIRDLLKAAGWEVRDNKDGTVEVRRG